jgi:hypothetical protein
VCPISIYDAVVADAVVVFSLASSPKMLLDANNANNLTNGKNGSWESLQSSVLVYPLIDLQAENDAL